MKESLQNKAIEKKELNAWISYVLKLYTQDDGCQSKIEK